MTLVNHLHSTPWFLSVKKGDDQRDKVICPKSHSELPTKSGFKPRPSGKPPLSLSPIDLGKRVMGAVLVNSPLPPRMLGVSMEYSSIHDPEMNLARLLNKPNRDPGPGLTNWRYNRESSEQERQEPLATNLSHDCSQVTSLF